MKFYSTQESLKTISNLQRFKNFFINELLRKDFIMYDLVYQNEKLFKQFEKGLKKINMLAYRKLVFYIYPSLHRGDLSIATKIDELDGIKIRDLYEVELPTDQLTERVYSTKYKLIFQKNENFINLIEIQPKKILIEHLEDNTLNYKGVIISKDDEKSHFKIDLLDMLNK